MRSLLGLLALAAQAASASDYNPRPFVLAVGSSCIATVISPHFAVTTDVCASLVSNGAGFSNFTARTLAEWPPVAILEIDQTFEEYAAIGASDPFIAGELIALQDEEAVSVPIAASQKDRGPDAFAVSPVAAGCPRTDGSPIFTNTNKFGSETWLDMSLVAIVNAATSSCATLTAIPLAPYAERIAALVLETSPVAIESFMRKDVMPINSDPTLITAAAAPSGDPTLMLNTAADPVSDPVSDPVADPVADPVSVQSAAMGYAALFSADGNASSTDNSNMTASSTDNTTSATDVSNLTSTRVFVHRPEQRSGGIHRSEEVIMYRRGPQRYDPLGSVLVVFVALGLIAACISPICIRWA